MVAAVRELCGVNIVSFRRERKPGPHNRQVPGKKAMGCHLCVTSCTRPRNRNSVGGQRELGTQPKQHRQLITPQAAAFFFRRPAHVRSFSHRVCSRNSPSWFGRRRLAFTVGYLFRVSATRPRRAMPCCTDLDDLCLPDLRQEVRAVIGHDPLQLRGKRILEPLTA